MTSDTTESGLESLIVRWLVDEAGYLPGRSEHFDKDHAVDLVKLRDFIKATQPKTAEALGRGEDSLNQAQLLHRLQGEIAKRGVVTNTIFNATYGATPGALTRIRGGLGKSVGGQGR